MSFAHRSQPPGVSDHGLLSGLLDHDHTQYGRLAEDEVLSGGWRVQDGALLRFGHAAGPTLAGPAANSLLSLTGQLSISQQAAIGGIAPAEATGLLIAQDPAPATGFGVYVNPANRDLVSAFYGFGFVPQVSLRLGTNSALFGVHGNASPQVVSGATGVNMFGLNFLAGVAAGGAGTVVAGITAENIRCQVVSFTGTVTSAKGIRVQNPLVVGGAPVITESVGVDILNAGSSNKIVDAISLRIADVTLATGNRYLIEAGPATPNLRLVANAPPNAGLATEGDSQLFLAWMENGVVNLRRTRWRDAAAVVAGDRVLIAV